MQTPGVNPKVVVVGAGSLFVGRQAIWQMVHSPYLNSGTLALVDTNHERLDKLVKLAKMVADDQGVSDIIENMIGGLGKPFYINTPNRGAVSNMSDAAYLELLCDVDLAGSKPRPVGEMPRGLRGMQEVVLDTHELTAEAVATCDRALLRRAMLTDPLITSIADAIIDELMETEREILPNGLISQLPWPGLNRQPQTASDPPVR